MEIQRLTRSFLFNGRKYADPDPSKTIEEVRQHYSTIDPSLNNASYEVETTGGEQKVKFTTAVGHKG